MRCALILAAGLAGATIAVAAPPRNVHVVPVYTNPPAIRVSFTEAGGVRNYNIFRLTDGAGEQQLASLPGGANGHVAQYLDKAVVATSTYTYRIQVCEQTGTCSFLSPDRTTSPKVVWPISGGREVLHGFNEVLAWAGPGLRLVPEGYHMGLDLNKTTPLLSAGDAVLAPRGGIVVAPKFPTLDNGSIGVKVDVGGGQFEYDTFNHIATTGAAAPPVAGGDVVAPGDKIAQIGTQNDFPGNFGKHVHFLVEFYDAESAPLPPGTQRAIRHPLAIFTTDADRDPLGKPPFLFDENKDGKVVLFRNHTTRSFIDYHFETTPLSGGVDVEVEVVDEQGTDPRQAPIDLGYWIEGPLPDAEQLDDVKTAAKPYRFYDFRVEYFGGIPGAVPGVPCDLVSDIADQANSGCRGLTNCSTDPKLACNSVIKEGTTDWIYPVLHHFIVTHAKGETGHRADLTDRNQFWSTTAKDDGEPAGSTHANYAGKPTTTKAWEARFPDGEYVIHVVASDLVHKDVDLPIKDDRSPPDPRDGIRLENFAPFVKEILVARDADGNSTTSQPFLPGCESIIHHYRHTHRQPYLRSQDILVSNVATSIVQPGQKLCVLIRFSETMASAAVDLVRERGTGTLVTGGTLMGGFSRTFQENDTWIGFVTLAADPSGASDVAPGSDERDTAIRIMAADRRDATGNQRTLDANSDGIPEIAGDLRHLVKLDLSVPTATINVDIP